MPTTRSPAFGPPSTSVRRIPAKSQPGRWPSGAEASIRSSPRFSEMARTSTTTSSGPTSGSGTSRNAIPPSTDRSTTNARTTAPPRIDDVRASQLVVPRIPGSNEPNGASGALLVAYELARSLLRGATDLAGLRHLNCFDASRHAPWRTSDRPYAADRHRPEHAVPGLHPVERGWRDA